MFLKRRYASALKAPLASAEVSYSTIASARARQHHALDGAPLGEELLQLLLLAVERQILDEDGGAGTRRGQHRRRVLALGRGLEAVDVDSRRAQRGLGLGDGVHLAEREAHRRVVALDVEQVALGHAEVRGGRGGHRVGAHEERPLGCGHRVLALSCALPPLLLALRLEGGGVARAGGAAGRRRHPRRPRRPAGGIAPPLARGNARRCS